MITKINDPNNCEEICGDGIRISNQLECDDGNQMDGDGCSSLCKIEKYWTCSGNFQNLFLYMI